MRYRLNLSLPEDLHETLVEISGDYGFSSPCEMAVTLLRLFAMKVKKSEAIPVMDVDAEMEIAEMFRELEEYEPEPSRTVVPRQHRTRK